MDLFNSEIKLWVPVSNISFGIASVKIKEDRKKKRNIRESKHMDSFESSSSLHSALLRWICSTGYTVLSLHLDNTCPVLHNCFILKWDLCQIQMWVCSTGYKVLSLHLECPILHNCCGLKWDFQQIES